MKPELINREYLKVYNINEAELESMYKIYKKYINLISSTKKGLKSKEIMYKEAVDRYYCEHCDKYVRYVIKYHHEHTKKHLENSNNKIPTKE